MFSITEQSEKTVLVVNDQADQLELMSLLLRTAGYRVLNASDGREGFAVARREQPDALISDVMMPGVSGIELCRLVRQDAELCTMPVLLVSALRFGTPDVVEGLRVGADDYLEAPYDPLRLVARLSRLIERKQMEHALREKAAREWQLTFDAVESLIVITDLEGRIVQLNRTAKELAGQSSAQIIGQPIDTFGREPPWRQAAQLINSMRTTHTAASAQVQDEASGQTWEISANSISEPEAGRERRIILVARDMTQSVEQQETLRRSETMSMMGELVVGVAHEVRNPLFGVASVLDAFEARLDEGSEYRTYSRMLREGLDRISELMHELLEYGKPLTQKLYPGHVEEMIILAVRACQQLAERAGVRIVNHIKEELPLVTMDRRRLPQVFQNLIENAIHHSTPGSVVTISAKTVCLKNKCWIECYVSDTGAGFRPEDLRNVFKPFFTRRRGGTGLGLSIAQRVMEEHGGRVTAGNQPGAGGAIMTVRFPSAVTPEVSEGGAAR